MLSKCLNVVLDFYFKDLYIYIAKERSEDRCEFDYATRTTSSFLSNRSIKLIESFSPRRQSESYSLLVFQLSKHLFLLLGYLYSLSSSSLFLLSFVLQEDQITSGVNRPIKEEARASGSKWNSWHETELNCPFPNRVGLVLMTALIHPYPLFYPLPSNVLIIRVPILFSFLLDRIIRISIKMRARKLFLKPFQRVKKSMMIPPRWSNV